MCRGLRGPTVDAVTDVVNCLFLFTISANTEPFFAKFVVRDCLVCQTSCLSDDIISPHILQQGGSILGDILSENMLLIGTVSHCIYFSPHIHSHNVMMTSKCHFDVIIM